MLAHQLPPREAIFYNLYPFRQQKAPSCLYNQGMRVLYIDSLMAFELAADFTLLWASSRLCAVRLKLWRGLLAALFGACYSAGAIFLPLLVSFPLKICAAGVMVLIAFGGEKRLWKPALAFLAASALFAGLCLALSYMGEGEV